MDNANKAVKNSTTTGRHTKASDKCTVCANLEN